LRLEVVVAWTIIMSRHSGRLAEAKISALALFAKNPSNPDE
jgi:hypothetical protein